VSTAAPTRRLRDLRNVGPAACKDFALLEITTVAELAQQTADDLFMRLQMLSGTRQDPCVWDVFAASIHEARTGEALNWWSLTPERKARQAAGTFPR
jgi:hypothetical protein